MAQLPDFEAWAIFAKVAERGSFSAAADELGIAKTTVSKAVTRLEQRLGASLLHRTTRRLSLTESGRLTLGRAQRILADGAAIEADVLEEAAVPRGLVRLMATTSFGVEALGPLLPEFLAAYPEVELDLWLTDEHVDPVASGVDVVLQIGGGGDSTLRISRLFSFRRPLVAAPAFVARHGVPRHPSDLAAMPAIVANHIPSPDDWQFSRGGETVSVHVHGSLRVNNAGAMLPALVAGLGVTLMPEFYIWRQVQDGSLVKLMEDWEAAPGPICVVTPPGRARPARVRVLLDFLRRHFAAQPWAIGIET